MRTGRTWLAYGALASYAYCLYGLGPVLAFLHADLHLSYTVTNTCYTPMQACPPGAPPPFAAPAAARAPAS